MSDNLRSVAIISHTGSVVRFASTEQLDLQRAILADARHELLLKWSSSNIPMLTHAYRVTYNVHVAHPSIENFAFNVEALYTGKSPISGVRFWLFTYHSHPPSLLFLCQLFCKKLLWLFLSFYLIMILYQHPILLSLKISLTCQLIFLYLSCWQLRNAYLFLGMASSQTPASQWLL